MNKKTEDVKVISIPKNAAVCQNCKGHSNNPSYCKTNQHYTGRKNTCGDFK